MLQTSSSMYYVLYIMYNESWAERLADDSQCFLRFFVVVVWRYRFWCDHMIRVDWSSAHHTTQPTAWESPS